MALQEIMLSIVYGFVFERIPSFKEPFSKLEARTGERQEILQERGGTKLSDSTAYCHKSTKLRIRKLKCAWCCRFPYLCPP